MPRSATHTPRARQKLLEAVVLLTEVQERREAAVATWEAAEDTCGSARALRAESAQARRHTQTLLRETASLMAKVERSLAEARGGFHPGGTDVPDSG